MGTIRVGTSGWRYKEFKDVLYAGVPQRRWLARYAEQFRAVEIDGSFYRMPRPDTLVRWAAETPDDFRFCFKMHRTVTHYYRLLPPKGWDWAHKLLDVVKNVGEAKLGPVLLQLHPSQAVDADRLDRFLRAMPGGFRWAIEARDAAWFDRADVEAVLREHRAAWVRADAPDLRTPPLDTADFAFFRFHGTSGWFRGAYGEDRLDAEADEIVAEADAGKDVWAFFNNTMHGDAARDALALRDLFADR